MGLPLLTSVTAGLRWPPETFAVQLQVHAHKLYAVYNLTVTKQQHAYLITSHSLDKPAAIAK